MNSRLSIYLVLVLLCVVQAQTSHSQTIWTAVTGGDIPTVRSFIENIGVNVDSKNQEGATLLMEAVRARQDSVVEYLVGRGANVNAKDKRGHTPLHLAVLSGSTMSLRLLLDRGADSRVAMGKFNILELAVNNSDVEMVKAIVRFNAQTGASDKLLVRTKNLSLTQNIILGNLPAVEKWLQAGNTISPKDVEMAVLADQVPVVEYLLGTGLVQKERYFGLLAAAVNCQSLAAAQCLLKKIGGVAVRCEYLSGGERVSGTVTEYAGRERERNLLIWLLGNGADPATALEYFFHDVGQDNDQAKFIEGARACIAAGVDPAKFIPNSVTYGKPEVLRFLINEAKKRKVNQDELAGLLNKEIFDIMKSALYSGGRAFDEEMITILIDSGADPSQCQEIDGVRWSPLIFAMDKYQYKSLKFAFLLLSKGADPNGTMSIRGKTVSAYGYAMDRYRTNRMGNQWGDLVNQMQARGARE